MQFGGGCINIKHHLAGWGDDGEQSFFRLYLSISLLFQKCLHTATQHVPWSRRCCGSDDGAHQTITTCGSKWRISQNWGACAIILAPVQDTLSCNTTTMNEPHCCFVIYLYIHYTPLHTVHVIVHTCNNCNILKRQWASFWPWNNVSKIIFQW